MKTYKSRYAELSFYVNGKERKFNGGLYVATTPEEVAVLSRISDAIAVDEAPKNEKPEEAQVPEQPQKPAPKPRKSSAK
jgi:hypothetical protein